MGRVRILVGVALAAFAALLIRGSIMQYDRFNVSYDYGLFEQAWWLMAHGHLAPYSSLFGRSFYSDHGSVIMLALAPLYWLNRNQGLTLLVVQDLAIAGSAGVGVAWIFEMARRRRAPAALTGVAAAAVIGLAALDPWVYKTTYQDFHLESLAIFLTLLAAWDFYCGRRGRGAVWALLAASAGGVACTYLVAVGLGLVAGARGSRREGAAMAALGAAALGVFTGLHADAGSQIDSFAYLAGRRSLPSGPGAILAVVGGALAHPSRAAHRISEVHKLIFDDLVPGAGLWILEPLMVVPVAVIVLINALSSNAAFIDTGFQNIPVYLLTAVGTGMAVVRLGGNRAWRAALTAVALVALVAPVVAYDRARLAHHRNIPFSVDGAAAAQLASVLRITPQGTEVISTFGTVGRFCGRRWAYTVFLPNQRFEVHSPTVEFVFVRGTGNEPLPPADITADEAWITGHLGGRYLLRAGEVQALVWHPPPSTTSVGLP